MCINKKVHQVYLCLLSFASGKYLLAVQKKMLFMKIDTANLLHNCLHIHIKI